MYKRRTFFVIFFFLRIFFASQPIVSLVNHVKKESRLCYLIACMLYFRLLQYFFIRLYFIPFRQRLWYHRFFSIRFASCCRQNKHKTEIKNMDFFFCCTHSAHIHSMISCFTLVYVVVRFLNGLKTNSIWILRQH